MTSSRRCGAAQRIGYLLDEIRLRGNEKELVDEVTLLARRFGVVTSYTSYLIREDEQRRVSANLLPPENQPPNAVPARARVAARMKGDYDAMQPAREGTESRGAPRVGTKRAVRAEESGVREVYE